MSPRRRRGARRARGGSGGPCSPGGEPGGASLPSSSKGVWGRQAANRKCTSTSLPPPPRPTGGLALPCASASPAAWPARGRGPAAAIAQQGSGPPCGGWQWQPWPPAMITLDLTAANRSCRVESVYGGFPCTLLAQGGRSNQRPEWQVNWCLRFGCRLARRLVHVCGLVNFPGHDPEGPRRVFEPRPADVVTRGLPGV